MRSRKGPAVPYYSLDSLMSHIRKLRPKEDDDDGIRSYSSAWWDGNRNPAPKSEFRNCVTIVELQQPGTCSRFPWQPCGTNHSLWVALTHSFYGFFF